MNDANPKPGLSRFGPALIGSLILIAACSALSFWASQKIGPDTRVPIHWNGKGEVDGYTGPVGLWYTVFVIIGLVVILAVLPWIEPRRSNLLRSSRAYQAVWLATVALMSMVHGGIVFTTLGYQVSMNRLMYLGVGLLFAVIGACMGKIQSNYMFGMRTPWTLSSELSWRKTHRLSSWLFALIAAMLIICGIAGADSGLVLVIIIVSVVAILIVPTIYSYVIWKKDPERSAPAYLFRKPEDGSKPAATESEKEG